MGGMRMSNGNDEDFITANRKSMVTIVLILRIELTWFFFCRDQG